MYLPLQGAIGDATSMTQKGNTRRRSLQVNVRMERVRALEKGKLPKNSTIPVSGICTVCVTQLVFRIKHPAEEFIRLILSLRDLMRRNRKKSPLEK